MKILKQLFRPCVITDDDGTAVSVLWIGDDHRAVLTNPDMTKIYASVVHDGHRKYYTTVCASLFAARRLYRRDVIVVAFRLRNFPRCAVELWRLKCRSMADAQDCVQALLDELRMI